jgi:hypothetical protein
MTTTLNTGSPAPSGVYPSGMYPTGTYRDGDVTKTWTYRDGNVIWGWADPGPAPKPPKRKHTGRNILIFFGCFLAVLCVAGGVALVINAASAGKAGTAYTVPSAPAGRAIPNVQCSDGTTSTATGAGACSHHGGVKNTTPTQPTTSTIPDGGPWRVGKDIQPGTYRASVPADSLNCYWARVKDASGTLDSIISNANAKPSTSVTVTVQDNDWGFESNGCGGWVRLG